MSAETVVNVYARDGGPFKIKLSCLTNRSPVFNQVFFPPVNEIHFSTYSNNTVENVLGWLAQQGFQSEIEDMEEMERFAESAQIDNLARYLKNYKNQKRAESQVPISSVSSAANDPHPSTSKANSTELKSSPKAFAIVSPLPSTSTKSPTQKTSVNACIASSTQNLTTPVTTKPKLPVAAAASSKDSSKMSTKEPDNYSCDISGESSHTAATRRLPGGQYGFWKEYLCKTDKQKTVNPLNSTAQAKTKALDRNDRSSSSSNDVQEAISDNEIAQHAVSHLNPNSINSSSAELAETIRSFNGFHIAHSNTSNTPASIRVDVHPPMNTSRAPQQVQSKSPKGNCALM